MNMAKMPAEFSPGQRYTGGAPRGMGTTGHRGAFNTPVEESSYGALLAIDPQTGKPKWEFKMTDLTDSGVLTTASDLLFVGGREGYFQALNAGTGELLWKASLGGSVESGPMTFRADGKQYITVAAGHSLFVFTLRN